MIRLEGVTARKGRFRLDGVSFEVRRGEYGVVIGPAGSGKTTLLEVVAGLLAPIGGRVTLSGVEMGSAPPESRGVGLVYQHAFLFPHLTVRANVAYGAADDGTLREAADRMGVTALFGREVRGLSGGERQLVALARALARRPRLLLLDEPFSALDPRRRTLIRREVRALHREWGLTTLQVTHDFAEAGMLGDQAILLDGGRVLQAGTPAEVFRRPASPYVAEFLGAENIFSGTARDLGEAAPDWVDGRPADLAHGHRAFAFQTEGLTLYAVGDFAAGAGHAVIRAEEITIARDHAHDSARNRFAGRVTEVASLGALTRVTVDVRGTPLIAALTTRSAHELAIEPGLAVVATFKAMAVHLC
ncbi:MAG: ATP-binding cassette domain-containing protein [Gemmatimonadota bacterium]|nr:ATP-binding cassette domain-containing protein [Gemmatimonadota bacterium]